MAPDISSIVRDQELAAILRRRLDEATTCRDCGTCLSAIIMLGSVLEGVLPDVAERFQEACERATPPPPTRGRRSGRSRNGRSPN